MLPRFIIRCLCLSSAFLRLSSVPTLPVSERNLLMSSFCRARFTFIKGPCLGHVIDHTFQSDTTVSQMKQYLMQTYGACNPNSQLLTFVWEEQMQKLSNDNQTAGTMGAVVNITVNVIKKRIPEIEAPSSSDQTIQVHAAALDSIPTTEPVSTQLPSPHHAMGTQYDHQFATAVSLAKQQGSRVRIEGLRMRPEINGRTGVICSAFNEENGRWTVLLDSSSSDAPCHVSIRAANLVAMHDTLITKATSSAASALPSDAKAVELAFAAMNPVSVPISPPVTHPAPLSVALKEGLHVRIKGLQSKPEMNGRTGVIHGAFNQESARWTVQIDADGTNISCQGYFRPINLKVIPAHNFSSEWLDEDGRVCPKTVDFSCNITRAASDDCLPVLSNVHSSAHDAQPLQFDRRACCSWRHCPSRGTSHMVHQPHLVQPLR
jgi:hypothetical protein